MAHEPPTDAAHDTTPADPVVSGLARSLEWLTSEQRAALARLLLERDGEAAGGLDT